MTITAISADGTQHQFPDGTNPSVIDGVMKQYAQGPGVMGTLKDVGQSALTGLSKGVNAVAGAYGDVRNMAANAFQNSPAASALPIAAALFPSAATMIRGAPSNAQLNQADQTVTGGYHTPQTTAGKYAETIASFAPAAVGGEGSLLGRAALRVALPGAASETAGQATAGTPLEPYARAGGAIAGGVTGALAPAGMRSIVSAANRGLSAVTGQSFLDPEQQAATTLARSIASGPGGAQGASQRAAQYGQVGASAPTAIDVGGGQTARTVRAAAMDFEGNAQNDAQTYADSVRAALPDLTIARAKTLTPDQRSATDVMAAVKQQRGIEAQTKYAGPYSQPVPVTPEVTRALADDHGQKAINLAYATASSHMDDAQMAELNALRNAAATQVKPDLSAALQDVKRARAPTPDETTILGAIRNQGGISTTNAAGDVTPMGGDLKSAMGSNPGYTMQIVNNNRSTAPGSIRGLPSDQMAARLRQSGWLGPGDDVDELHDLINRATSGEKIYHPTSDIHGELEYRDALDREAQNAGITNADSTEQAAQKLNAYRQKIDPNGYLALQQSLSNTLKSTSAASLDHVRIAMRRMADTYAQSPDTAGLASGLRKRIALIDTALNQAPGLQDARAAYRAASANRQAVQTGQTAILPGTSPSDYASQLAELSAQSPQARQFAGIGYRQAMVDKLGSAAEGNYSPAKTLGTAPNQGQNLAATFGPQQAQDFQTALKLEVARARQATAITPGAGSKTAGVSMDVGFPLYTPTGAMFALARKFMQGTTTPAERAAIVKMGIDPNKLQSIIQQAGKISRPTLHGPAAATAIGFQQQANP